MLPLQQALAGNVFGDSWLFHTKTCRYWPKMVLDNSNYWSSSSHPCRIMTACHQPGNSVIGHDIWTDIMWFLWLSLGRTATYKNWIRLRLRCTMDYSDWDPGPWFNIKMSSYQYRKSHYGDKTVVRSSYLHNGISFTGKMTYLYWIKA